MRQVWGRIRAWRDRVVPVTSCAVFRVENCFTQRNGCLRVAGLCLSQLIVELSALLLRKAEKKVSENLNLPRSIGCTWRELPFAMSVELRRHHGWRYAVHFGGNQIAFNPIQLEPKTNLSQLNTNRPSFTFESMAIQTRQTTRECVDELIPRWVSRSF